MKGLLAELHDRLRGLVREDAGRDPEPTAAIVDSQSVKADATVSSSSRGYDAGKKINGSSSREGSHLPALTEPCVTVSRYTALAALIS
ncbi:hypothetical protein ACWD3E_41860, partial [Streptomyces sp. NPDC002676]